MTVSLGPVRIAAAALVLLSVSGPASAQGYYYWPWAPDVYGRPVPPARVPLPRFRDELPPWEIETMLRSMGYSQISRPRLAGPVYRVVASDRRGWRVALVVDSETGRLLEREALGATIDPRDFDERPAPRSTKPKPSQKPSEAARTPAEPSSPTTKPEAVPEASLPPAPGPAAPSPSPSDAKLPQPDKPTVYSPPATPAKPAETAKPAAPTLTPVAKPAEAAKPHEAARPAEPASAPKPAASAKTPEPAKPAPKPVATPNPAPASKPAAKPTDTSRPVWAQRRPADDKATPPAAKKPNPPVDLPPVQGFE